MSAESPRHARSGGPLTVAPQPPTDRSLIDAVSGFINDVKLTSSPPQDPKDTIQWARFETADVNEPTPEGESSDISPLLLILGYGAGVQVWLIPPTGEAQEVLSWRQGTVRVLRILPTPQNGDSFASKRPLIALCDSASPGPTFCSLSFLSIRGGEQVKSIKFKNPILDVLANKRSIVVSFSERFAVFDAGTLEDRMAVTTCFPCPCPLGGSSPINPLALGDRWLAYADKKVNPSKRSSGGCEGEGVSSYTATVLHAAKSLGKGLRGLGESVAQSLAGAPRGASPPRLEHHQPGVVTVIDIEGNNEDDIQEGGEPYDPIIAHFIAHSEAIIALKFDPSGMLLITADRRGHDFHVFRIHPHPCGPSLAAVHHLYILHRGDTTSKVQDIAISADSRWAAISTLRGTTHIFPCSPYGGPCGVRTHTPPRVVNRLSRFHRSAGLPLHAATAAAAGNNPPRSHSPIEAGSPRFPESACYVGMGAGAAGGAGGAWGPSPPAHSLTPLAQHRAGPSRPAAAITRTSAGRQRLSSLSEDGNSAPLLARACFGPYSASAMSTNKTPAQLSLYVVSANGCLVHLALHPRPAKSVPKEKISDDSQIEVEVESIVQWSLQRGSVHGDLLVPLPPRSPLLVAHPAQRGAENSVSDEERWLSQVEIVTHAGPHRRLWMGPQFLFKTYNCTGSTSSLSEAETVEIETSVSNGMARSTPVNMPGVRSIVPLLIDSGSASSLEHSPSDSFRRKSMLAETASVCDVQLREQLADAMKEEQGLGLRTARAEVEERRGGRVARAVGPFGTVVAPEERTTPPRDSSDPDAHTLSNTDETCFRPVLPTSALLPPPLTLDTRPLPRDTTIPVESMTQQSVFSPQDEPLPLTENTVIPAALGQARYIDRSLDMEADVVESICKVPYNVFAPVPATVDPAPTVCNPSPDIADPVPDISDPVAEISEPVPDISDPVPDISDTVPDISDTVPDVSNAVPDISDPVDEVLKNKPVTSKRAKTHVNNSSYNLVNVDNKIHVNENKDLKANEVMPERECVNKSDKDRDSLPNPSRSDDIQPAVRVKKSPTPTPAVEDAAGGVSIKDNKTKERKENKSKSSANKKEREGKSSKNKHNLDKKDFKEPKVNTPKITNLQFDSNEISEVDGALKIINTSLDSNKCIVPETESKAQEFNIEYNKGSKSGKVIKEKKKSTSEITTAAIEPIPKNNKEIKDKEKSPVSEIINIDVNDMSCSEKTSLSDDNVIVVQPKLKKEMSPVQKLEKALSKETSPAKDLTEVDEVEKISVNKYDIEVTQPQTANNDSSIEVTLRLAPPTPAPRRAIIMEPEEIKTEEQAWDLLLTETEKTVDLSPRQSITETITEEPKSKTKKRRNKKVLDEIINRADDDNFVEIHTIEHKIQECSELVSITVPLEDNDIDYPPMNKCKSRSPNLSNPETFAVTPYKMEMGLFEICPRSPLKHLMLTTPQRQRAQLTEIIEEKPKTQSPYLSRNITVIDKESSMYKKDLIVIDSTNEEFPDIKITKDRFKPMRRDDFLPEFIAKPPVKSWSSIAATKSKVAVNEPAIIIPKMEQKLNKLPKRTMIQDKLFELYQRTDIMIADCDTPSNLNFVDEHHTMSDLPPLEPLDFALDDFKLEVMRDSLLDISETKVMSPIRKISIDKILSSFKEPAKKTLESSTFNLVGLKATAEKSVKGFSIVESNITTQEIDINKDKCKGDERDDVVEKSSDDDNTSPVVSTDSDKEEKKSANAVSVTMPSKEAAKPKKSRRKKK